MSSNETVLKYRPIKEMNTGENDGSNTGPGRDIYFYNVWRRNSRQNAFAVVCRI